MFSRNENIVLAIIVTIAMIIGINQLSRDNDIFAETLVYCCNAGYCHENSCSSTSSVKLYSDGCIQDYIVNCYTCMDYKAGGLVCNYSGDDYCWDNGEKYYGEWAK